MCLELIATIYHVLILDTGFFVCFLENSLVFMYYSKKFTLCINTTCLVVTKYYSGDSSSSTWICICKCNKCKNMRRFYVKTTENIEESRSLFIWIAITVSFFFIHEETTQQLAFLYVWRKKLCILHKLCASIQYKI